MGSIEPLLSKSADDITTGFSTVGLKKEFLPVFPARISTYPSLFKSATFRQFHHPYESIKPNTFVCSENLSPSFRKILMGIHSPAITKSGLLSEFKSAHTAEDTIPGNSNWSFNCLVTS